MTANLRPGGRRKITEGELWWARVPGVCQKMRVRTIRFVGTKRDPAWRVGLVVPGCRHEARCVVGEHVTLVERDLLEPAPRVDLVQHIREKLAMEGERFASEAKLRAAVESARFREDLDG